MSQTPRDWERRGRWTRRRLRWQEKLGGMGLMCGCCRGGDGKPSTPREKCQRSLRSMEETEDGSSDGEKERWTVFNSANSSLSSPARFTELKESHPIIHWGSQEEYLRHRNDHEIQPVPWISEECKPVYTEASRRDFYKRLKCINSCECVPARQNTGRISSARWAKVHTNTYTQTSTLLSSANTRENTKLFRNKWIIHNK